MATAVAERLNARDLNPRIGSEVVNDKATLLSGAIAQDIRALLEERGVLVFPKIGFTDEEQIAFTETLGTFAPELQGEKIYKVTLDTKVNALADYLKGSLYWHLDGTMNEVPILASLLAMKQLPSDGGGDTLFCNTYAAYDDLSEEEKAEIDGLKVMHSSWASLFYYAPETDLKMLEQMQAIGENELPLVWNHRSGRKSLVLGCTARRVVGMEDKDSIRTLVKYREWATQPHYVYRHTWSVGDLVMWDNTGTMHKATPYNPHSGRLLNRTKLQGEEPFA